MIKLIKRLSLFTLLIFNLTILSASLEFITSDAIITPQLSSNAIIRQEAGFETDFLILHCLVKQFKPKKLFEIGTCEGYGTLIMANACPSCTLISLDLPPHTAPFFLTLADIGRKCSRPFQQVFGDSLAYNYTQHFPIDAWFIDGAHDYQHVLHETNQAVASNAQLIIYHDTDIPEVLQAIVDALDGTEYKIYRITDSRVSYAIK